MVNYVLNVLPDPLPALEEAKRYVIPGGLIMVSCRTPGEVAKAAKKGAWEMSGRGYITSTGTYQRGIHQEALIKMIDWEVVKSGGGPFSWVISRKPLL